MNPFYGIIIAGVVAWLIIAGVFLGVVKIGQKADELSKNWAEKQRAKRAAQH